MFSNEIQQHSSMKHGFLLLFISGKYVKYHMEGGGSSQQLQKMMKPQSLY